MLTTRRKFDFYKKSSGIYYCSVLSPTTGDKLFTMSTRSKNKHEAMRIINKWFDSGFPQKNSNSVQYVENIDVMKNLHTLIIDNKLEAEEGLNSVLFFLSSYKNKIPTATANKFVTTCASILNIDIEQKTNTALDVKQDKNESGKAVDFLVDYWDYDKSPYIKSLISSGTPKHEMPLKQRFDTNYKWVKKHIKYFENKDIKLNEVTHDDINAFFSRIISGDVMTSSSFYTFSKTIRQSLKFAEKRKLIKPHILSEVKKYRKVKPKKEILTKEEAANLFSSQSNFKDFEHFCINRLAVETACRVGELQALKISDLKITNNKDCWVSVDKTWNTKDHILKPTKTKESKIVKLSDDMFCLLKKLIESNPFKNDKNAFLFYDKIRKDQPLSYFVIKSEFKKAITRLGYYKKGLTFHSYRHLAVVILADNNYTENEIMLLTGHKNINTLMVYMDHQTAAQMNKKELMANSICNFLKNH